MRRSPLLAVFLTVVIDLLGFGLVLPLLPLYADRYGASGGTIGLLFSSFSALQFLAAPVWGRLSDRIGRRPVILVGLAGSVASYVLFGIADSTAAPLTLLFVSRITAGLFGGTISTAYAYIADVTSSAERGRGMALIGAAFGIGFTLGPVLGGLGYAISPAAPGFIAAAFSAAALLFAWFRLTEPERHASARGERSWKAFGRAMAVPGVFRILVLTFLTHACFSLFESTLALLVKHRFTFGPLKNGLLFTYVGFWSAMTQGFLVRRLMPRVGEWRFTVIGSIVLALGLVAVGQVQSVLLLLALAPIPVLGFAMLTPSLASLLSRRVDPATQGGSFGLNQSGASLARILGPYVGLTLLELGRQRGYVVSLPHVVGAALMALGLVLALGLRPRGAPPPVTAARDG